LDGSSSLPSPSGALLHALAKISMLVSPKRDSN
jgi:hypothetical protein